MHTFSRMPPLFILGGLKAFLRFLQYEVLSTFRRDMWLYSLNSLPQIASFYKIVGARFFFSVESISAIRYRVIRSGVWE